MKPLLLSSSSRECCFTFWLSVLRTDAVLGSNVPRKFKENGLKICQPQRDQVLFVFSHFPQKEQRYWRVSPRKRDHSFIMYSDSHPTPASDPHPNLSSFPCLSLCQVVSNTYAHAEEGKKENNNNESQWTNQSFHIAWKSPGRGCCNVWFQTGVQMWRWGPRWKWKFRRWEGNPEGGKDLLPVDNPNNVVDEGSVRTGVSQL